MKEFDHEAIIANANSERRVRAANFEAARTASRALFADEDGQPTLRPSFVVYLDELGTSARLTGMSNEDLREDLRAYDDLRSFLHDEVDGWDADTQRTLYFSDNLVVVSPVTTETSNRDLGLFFQIWAAAAYQLNMAVRGRLLRGGITVGDAYADDTFVTGPAHLNAVLLEENVADNPRIVLDEICIELAREEYNNGGYADKLSSPYGAFLLLDADGQTFVNYLVTVSEDEGWDANVTDVGLIAHKKRVEAALASQPANKVLAKLRWVAAYHNYVCETFYNRPGLTIADIPPVAFSRFS
ncbi:MAG: hypothetical protein ABF306_10350 [Nocardioides marinisabuli]|uniref:hypothetical protein n=1 Tax=Nocardioides marinisabuli TaxID=419476 RepID=UPI00321B57CC